MTAQEQSVCERPCLCPGQAGPTRTQQDRQGRLPRQEIQGRFWRRQAGQHMGEYAILMGLVAAAAVGMQYYARRAVTSGMQAVSDTALGEPEPDPSIKALGVTTTQSARETGSAGGARVTTFNDSVTGHAMNEDTRLRITPYDKAIPRPPGQAVPRDDLLGDDPDAYDIEIGWTP